MVTRLTAVFRRTTFDRTLFGSERQHAILPVQLYLGVDRRVVVLALGLVGVRFNESVEALVVLGDGERVAGPPQEALQNLLHEVEKVLRSAAKQTEEACEYRALVLGKLNEK
jgi:hypothetical protein